MPMTRDELTANFQGAVLYYLDAIDEAVRWTDDLSTVCAVDFEDVGDPPVRQMIILENSWLPDSAEFPEPSIEDLMAYDLADVQEFYANKYANPAMVQSYQHWAKLSSAAIDACYVDDTMDGWIVWDTTMHRLRYYDRPTLSWITYT